jgi:hypothetical protein
MSLNEADTRAQLIDPQLNRAGWTRSQVTREHYYRPDWEFAPGRVVLRGGKAQREKPLGVVVPAKGTPRTDALSAEEDRAKARDYERTALKRVTTNEARDYERKTALKRVTTNEARDYKQSA